VSADATSLPPSGRDHRRRFGSRERDALYLAADGKCEQCGIELGADWHADHVTPWSRGGPTDVINGQALCPKCNLEKGTSMGLRTWQQEALDRFDLKGRPRDFLAAATPGAGKTTFALTLARRLLNAGIVKRIVVVVPTDNLRKQWADQSIVSLVAVSCSADYRKRGPEGFVVTYQQLMPGSTGPDNCRQATSVPTLAILDEIHHAGESKSWGDGLSRALELAKYRLALTGTPWRSDKRSPIPFVRYDESGKVIVDTSYEYGQAVADGVCRRLEFDAYDGEARWHDCVREVTADLSDDDLSDEDLSAALNAALDPEHEWIAGLIGKANEALVELRLEVPDAGGLVIAHSEWHARGYAKILRRITGADPTVVVSADPDAGERLEGFRKGRSPWLVAIRMVSEGVDIPRLAVGVYASKIKTPLFFRQACGRFVRVRENEDIQARIYLPAIPSLMALAKQIEDELRHQLEQTPVETGGGGGGQNRFLIPLGASMPEFAGAIVGGDHITVEEFSQAETFCRQHGIPERWAANVAQGHRGASDQANAAVPAVPLIEEPSYYRRERLLRGETETLSRKLACVTGREVRDVNGDLLRAGYPRRASASLEELEAIKGQLLRWMGGVR
jgi:superfamily II DNA or RNA helicase